MSDSDRKKFLIDLEAEFRRTETALAVAQAEFEKAYAALCVYMNEHAAGPPRTVMFSPGVTLH
jgi:hypothetical protein